MRVVLLWAMLVAYGLAAVLGVVSALSWDTSAISLLATSLTLAGAFTVGLLLAVCMERGQRGIRWLMVLGMVCIAISMIGWLILIWVSYSSYVLRIDEQIMRTSFGFMFASFWSLFVGYCFFFRVRYAWYRILIWALFACSVWFLFLLETAVIDEDVVEFIAKRVFLDEDAFFRVLVALIVVFSAGSLSLPIIWLISRNVQFGDDAVLGRQFEVAMTCPRCGFAQEIPTKVGHCKQCRLEIRVKIEEPRCTCGFLLYRFEGEACPECGRPVPESKRWATVSP